jgi:hypothetical protein
MQAEMHLGVFGKRAAHTDDADEHMRSRHPRTAGRGRESDRIRSSNKASRFLATTLARQIGATVGHLLNFDVDATFGNLEFPLLS